MLARVRVYSILPPNTPVEVASMWAASGGRPPLDRLPPSTPPEVVAMVRDAWALDQGARPSFTAIKKVLQDAVYL